MKNLDLRDFIGGCLLTGVGLAVSLYAGNQYEVGQASRMGPGYFPVALGVILAVLGIIIALLAFKKVPQALQPPPFRLRPLLAILAAVLAFALVVTRLGLVPATLVLVAIASRAEPNAPLDRTLILGLALSVIAWLIFVVGLQMQLPAFAFSLKG